MWDKLVDWGWKLGGASALVAAAIAFYLFLPTEHTEISGFTTRAVCSSPVQGSLALSMCRTDAGLTHALTAAGIAALLVGLPLGIWAHNRPDRRRSLGVPDD
jgi:hypothetical protein